MEATVCRKGFELKVQIDLEVKKVCWSRAETIRNLTQHCPQQRKQVGNHFYLLPNLAFIQNSQ